MDQYSKSPSLSLSSITRINLSASDMSSSSTMPTEIALRKKSTAVQSSVFFSATFAPNCNKRSDIAVEPRSQASISGVNPPLSVGWPSAERVPSRDRRLAFAPAFSSNRTFSSFNAPIASCKGVHPPSSRTFTL
uniref:Secreted protein n=1 Tax=Ascaris lumbricoides TaxID=6252 RepID=A0A0M3HK35_ASCLU